jgi:nicotinamide riboside kinase
VAVVGPESTGKTTLARRLAEALGGLWVAEGARVYVDRRRARGVDAVLGPDDVDGIAHVQIGMQDAAARRATRAGYPLVVRDTDLVSSVVYARHYVGACPAWVVEAARARRADLYLLCDADVPWTPEAGQRDPSGADPHVRAHLRDAFAAAIAELDCRTVWVRGGWAERERAAVAAVRVLLAELKTPGAP